MAASGAHKLCKRREKSRDLFGSAEKSTVAPQTNIISERLLLSKQIRKRGSHLEHRQHKLEPECLST